MDIYAIIRALHAEKEWLDRAIGALEQLRSNADVDGLITGAKRRGRKSMSPEERRELSERMKKYWAQRRKP